MNPADHLGADGDAGRGVVVPQDVMHKVRALGAVGDAWIRALPDVVGELADRWDLAIGPVLTGGSGALVVAVRAGALDAVLKLAIPDGLVGHSDYRVELDTLLLGGPTAYVQVLAHDIDARALLLERLGRPLAAAGLAVETQIDVIAATLRPGWVAVEPSCGLRSGAEQAVSVAADIERRWEELDRPVSARVVDRALTALDARWRARSSETARPVLVHGDAHPHNVLAVPGTSRWKLIDPDGMRSEPAHDLAICLRDWSAELLAVDDPAATARRWCARLAAAGGAPTAAVWEWAYAERVSTGLFARSLGHPIAAPMLAVAELLADA